MAIVVIRGKWFSQKCDGPVAGRAWANAGFGPNDFAKQTNETTAHATIAERKTLPFLNPREVENRFLSAL
jgi:hypothetical protein